MKKDKHYKRIPGRTDSVFSNCAVSNHHISACAKLSWGVKIESIGQGIHCIEK